MDADQIQGEWEAALEDAGSTGEEVAMFLTELPPVTGRGAQWWEPGMAIEVKAEDDLVTEELAAEANAPQHLNRHRIVVRRPLASDPVSIATFSGKLRHELEHARQWNACGPPPFQLNDIADRVLSRKLKGLPRGNTVANLKPIEQDANAASAMFLRARWPEAIPTILEDLDNGGLARSLTPPGSFDTLVKRMVAFLYLHEDICAAVGANWPTGFGFILNDIAPDVRNFWETLHATTVAPFWPSSGPPGRELPTNVGWENG